MAYRAYVKIADRRCKVCDTLSIKRVHGTWCTRCRRFLDSKMNPVQPDIRH